MMPAIGPMGPRRGHALAGAGADCIADEWMPVIGKTAKDSGGDGGRLSGEPRSAGAFSDPGESAGPHDPRSRGRRGARFRRGKASHAGGLIPTIRQ